MLQTAVHTSPISAETSVFQTLKSFLLSCRILLSCCTFIISLESYKNIWHKYNWKKNGSDWKYTRISKYTTDVPFKAVSCSRPRQVQVHPALRDPIITPVSPTDPALFWYFCTCAFTCMRTFSDGTIKILNHLWHNQSWTTSLLLLSLDDILIHIYTAKAPKWSGEVWLSLLSWVILRINQFEKRGAAFKILVF